MFCSLFLRAEDTEFTVNSGELLKCGTRNSGIRNSGIRNYGIAEYGKDKMAADDDRTLLFEKV